MKQVKIFNFNDNCCDFNAESEVEEQANKWLAEHPEAVYINSHTNMQTGMNVESDEVWCDFTLTLIVELPDPKDTQSLIDEALAIAKEYPAIEITPVQDAEKWRVNLPELGWYNIPVNSAENLLENVKYAQSSLLQLKQ